mmetsp:Transcript_17942/g.32760  ORF Transcript_17942/g.32760 Transcript_17942/m.32760 type:complete len:257 (-) Transcript_17942:623-1393(-)
MALGVNFWMPSTAAAEEDDKDPLTLTTPSPPFPWPSLRKTTISLGSGLEPMGPSPPPPPRIFLGRGALAWVKATMEFSHTSGPSFAEMERKTAISPPTAPPATTVESKRSTYTIKSGFSRRNDDWISERIRAFEDTHAALGESPGVSMIVKSMPEVRPLKICTFDVDPENGSTASRRPRRRRANWVFPVPFMPIKNILIWTPKGDEGDGEEDDGEEGDDEISLLRFKASRVAASTGSGLDPGRRHGAFSFSAKFRR